LRIIYTLGFLLVVPLFFARLLWKSRILPAYRKRWLERLGLNLPPVPHHGLWLHAVSVGEAVAAVPIIKWLQTHYPDLAITVTSTTVTGSERVVKALGTSVFHCYLPYDIPWSLQRFIHKIQPRLAIMMETELWPNLFFTCQKNKLPILIANARLSPHSMRGYQKAQALFLATLDCTAMVAAQSELDADRFLKLGLPAEKLCVTGNMKFDVPTPPDAEEKGQILRQSFGQRSVLIAASTHEGEESLILQAYKEIKEKCSDALLVLVPRHPERFKAVFELVKAQGWSCVKRSTQEPCLTDTAVYLADTMGELPLLYAASDVAFVGGSLVSIGGHNMLEAAVLGIPVLTGPYLHNFNYISQALSAAAGMMVIESPSALAQAVQQWFNDAAARQAVGARAKAVVLRNQGAVERLGRWIDRLLKTATSD